MRLLLRRRSRPKGIKLRVRLHYCWNARTSESYRVRVERSPPIEAPAPWVKWGSYGKYVGGYSDLFGCWEEARKHAVALAEEYDAPLVDFVVEGEQIPLDRYCDERWM